MSEREYLPALRFSALTRFFDPMLRIAMPERRFKQRLVARAAPRAGRSVLDLGCGTGTLAIMVKQAEPAAEVVGLDADPEILELARSKAEDAAVEVQFDRGLSTELPYEEESFDLVLSTLFFHHLDPEAKRTTAREVARVLRPGGQLHVADWGRPSDPLMAAAFLGVRIFDGFANTRDNARGALPEIFEAAGLDEAEQAGRERTVFGTLDFLTARRPRSRSSMRSRLRA